MIERESTVREGLQRAADRARRTLIEHVPSGPDRLCVICGVRRCSTRAEAFAELAWQGAIYTGPDESSIEAD